MSTQRETIKKLDRITILYFTVLLADLILIATNQLQLRWISKPMLVLVLIFGLISKRTRINKEYFIPWIAALIFSWLGDVFLLLEDSMFVAGLSAFLISHLSYIFLFYRIKPDAGVKKGISLFVISFTIVYFILFYRIILVNTGDLFPAVLVYALVILGMWLMAAYKSIRQDHTNFWLLMGALFFVVSDSLLGYNKFVQFVPLFSTLVMLTYGLAQYGLFRGILRSDKIM